MQYVIKEQISITGKHFIKSNKIFNIAYGVDKNFLLGSAISINSILISNAEVDFNFHLFTDYLDKICIQRFQKMIKNHNSSITIYILNALELKELPIGSCWSYATYFRLISFEHLSNDNMNSILYLDADIICKGNLKELLNLELTDSFAAVVLDVDSMQKSSAIRLRLPNLNGKYFNAGVIYLNLKKWAENDFTKKSLKLLKKNNVVDYKYLDQDVLNILFQKKNIYLSQDYNCICTLKNELVNHRLREYKNIITDSTILIHHTGITKPWHTWGINYAMSQFFLNSYTHSPWKDYPLKTAEKKVELQEKYKHLLLQSKYIQSLFCLAKYKLKNKFAIRIQIRYLSVILNRYLNS